jgi:hypothetical protein
MACATASLKTPLAQAYAERIDTKAHNAYCGYPATGEQI